MRGLSAGLLSLLACGTAASSASSWLDIIVAHDAAPPPPLLLLAAQQLRRYTHALDRRLAIASMAVANSSAATAALCTSSAARVAVVLSVDATVRGAFSIVAPPTTTSNADGDAARVDIRGSDARGALDGVTTLLRTMGVGFGADGPPTLPPTAEARARVAASGSGAALLNRGGGAPAAALAAALSDAAASLHLAAAPAFDFRGFQPWGSYPMGNDWWSVDEYRRVVELIVQLRGNWVGMHDYGVNYGIGAEPGVWVGASSAAVSPSGNVTPSGGYNASWASTQRGLWGFGTAPTGSYPYGAAALFEHDCFGNRDVLSGDAELCPYPQSRAASSEMFNRVGAVYGSAFAFAAELGVRTALGTETPLSIPPDGDALVPLYTWWSPVRDDTFVSATLCAECPPESRYELAGIAGYAYAGDDDGRLPLRCFWDDAALDAWTGVGDPPSPAYALVRTEAYAPPPGTAGATAPLYQVSRTYNKAAGPALDWWAASGAMLSNASARGYAGSATPFAFVFPDAPPATDPLVAAYNATFTRLDRLYGRNLTW